MKRKSHNYHIKSLTLMLNQLWCLLNMWNFHRKHWFKMPRFGASFWFLFVLFRVLAVKVLLLHDNSSDSAKVGLVDFLVPFLNQQGWVFSQKQTAKVHKFYIQKKSTNIAIPSLKLTERLPLKFWQIPKGRNNIPTIIQPSIFSS